MQESHPVTITFPGHPPIHTTSEDIARAAEKVRNGGLSVNEARETVGLSAMAAVRNNDSQLSGEAASRESAGQDLPGSNGISGGQVRSFVERIERLDEDRKAIVDDIKEVFAEAKANGFDVKILRKVIAMRKVPASERAEMEAMIELYLDAVQQLPLPL